MSALTQIVRKAKAIRKRHPKKHKKWAGYVKEASAIYNRGGKMTGTSRKRKTVVKRKRTTKRKRVAKVASVGVVRRVRRAPRKRAVKKVTRRRVGASGKSSLVMPLVLLGGAALLFMALKKPSSSQPPAGTYPPLIQTSNPQRDQTSQNILNYALAANLTFDAITKLIKALNTKTDTEVKQIAESVDSGGGIPDWIMYGY